MSTRTAELVIDSIAAGGDGVGRADGLAVFVPRTAPGDRALVRLTPKGRFARGEVVELLALSEWRTEPPCPHYRVDQCGGCQLQHLAYDAQLEAKQRIVADALTRIGRREVEAPPVRAAAEPWRYRRKLTLAFRRRGERWIAGLHPYDDPRRVFPLRDCPITDERVMSVWREVLAASPLLPSARELRGAVRLDGQGASFTLEGGDAWRSSARFFDAVGALDSVWWTPERGARRLLHRRGPEQAPGASFAQVNAEMAGALHAHVIERAMSYAPAAVVDAYAGLGDTAASLAERGVRTVAIELDRAAAAWCAARLPAGSRAVAARTEDALPSALPADVVILNPPRAGVDERVTATLDAASPPPRAVLYVSCNPATLARDLARLPRYHIASLLAFDMFPQTAHVETVCELTPAPA